MYVFGAIECGHEVTMKLCSYTLRVDYGFAPNPFWEFCTLAACTPNHQGVRLKSGDWIMGHSDLSHGNRLVYAMRLSEVTGFDEYYHDPRFARKKPKVDGTWKQRCGDNIYHLENDEWIQSETIYHDDDEHRAQDTAYARVYISDHFYYFGENSIAIPPKFAELIRDRQGCKTSHDPEVVASFIEWLESSFTPGRHGNPRDAAIETIGCSTTKLPVPKKSLPCRPVKRALTSRA